MDKTILYFTSNREDQIFEEKIIANLIKQKGDLPVISVSQRPINLGKNICVGDVGHTYFNEYRQILIGAKEAKTPYVIFAESDFLYPPEYFNFEPLNANIYRHKNVWILYKDSRLYSFRRKNYSIGAQICKRDFVISLIEKYLNGHPEWSRDEVVLVKKRGFDMFKTDFEPFGSDNPCISFKTDDGMRKSTSVMHGKKNITLRLPLWGHVSILRKAYFNQ